MKDLKLLVKDLENYIRTQKILYATDGTKRFYVTLWAGPNIERYIVEKDGKQKGFTNKSKAVKYFNEL